MASSVSKTISLNLSPDYASNWGAWEVAREFICNAIDADPDGMKIEHEGVNLLRISTETVPEIADIFIIGKGSKGIGSEKIGQFGEGMKMAALVCTRMKNATCMMRIPGKEITFRFEKVMGTKVLHAQVTPCKKHKEGYLVEVRMPGIVKAYEGKILDSREHGIVGPAKEEFMKIYSKGIYLCQVDNKSLWDWNLNDISMNRDRAMVSNFDIRLKISNFFDAKMTGELAKEMITHEQSYESETISGLIHAAEARQRLADAFVEVHGEEACIAADKDVTNERAQSKGKIPVKVNENLKTCLIGGGIKTAGHFLTAIDDLESVEIEPYQSQIDLLRSFDSILQPPNFQISIFQNREEASKGISQINDRRMWLNESLFAAGNTLELLRTYFHELAHFTSEAGDATVLFEHAQDAISGKLGMRILENP